MLREIEDVQTPIQVDSKIKSKFIDMLDNVIDLEAQKLLDNLKNKLRQEIPKYNFIKLKVNL